MQTHFAIFKISEMSFDIGVNHDIACNECKQHFQNALNFHLFSREAYSRALTSSSLKSRFQESANKKHQ
jgi:hypothetical protein